MTEKKALYTGLFGTVFTGICCVTPLAVIGFTAFGLSAWIGWLDYVLLPSFAGFAAFSAYAYWRIQKA